MKSGTAARIGCGWWGSLVEGGVVLSGGTGAVESTLAETEGRTEVIGALTIESPESEERWKAMETFRLVGVVSLAADDAAEAEGDTEGD
jgi:hypothetical protein